ncbi:MAG: hypothetical protein HYZ96_01860 [Candidatus Omnitrophica bacterium]|nr:hypothetical protein [Candidatus Omnitrophota bacterium]
MKVTLHPHAVERMAERGVSRDEVVTEVVAVEETGRWLVITVIARYF